MLCFVFLIVTFFLTAHAAERPPKIEIQPKPAEVLFISGQEVSLPCVASGSPTPTYSWKLKGHNFTLPGRNGSIVQIPEEGTIVFKSPVPSDEGIYQCFASNDYGVSASEKFILREARMERFPPDDPITLTVPLGESLTIPCYLPRSYPKLEVGWGIREPDGRWSPLESTQRVSMDPEGTLHFTNVKKSDEQDGRPYVCMVWNVFLRRSSMGKEHVVQVQGGVELKKPAVTMWTSPTYMSFLKGDDLELTCIFYGNPTPDVTWEKLSGDKTLPEDRMESKNGSKLHIFDVQLSDEGQYRCVGHNSRTLNDRPSENFRVRIESRPYWIVEPVDVIANIGDDVIFTCEADGVPQPDIMWYINGVPLRSSQDPRVKSERFEELNSNNFTLKNLSVEDRMNIQCNASNPHGYIWADVYLNFQDTSNPGGPSSAAPFIYVCFLAILLEIVCVLFFCS